MLDPEYVKRIDSEMEESGGELAPDDHEGVWENLKSHSEWGAELEFSIALLTDMTLDEVREMTSNEAAKRHPKLSREEALKAEIQIRDVIQRAAENSNYLDKIARMQRDPATPMGLFGDEEAEDLDVGGDEDGPCGCDSDREAKAIRCNGSLGERLRSECERVVRELEAAVERLMTIEDGEEPLELHDGVQSVVLGSLAGKTVQIEIHVQPGLDDDYWSQAGVSLRMPPITTAQSDLAGRTRRGCPEQRISDARQRRRVVPVLGELKCDRCDRD